MIPYINEISMSIIVLVVGTLLVRWHLNPNNKFDLTDALIGDDGKFSLFRFGQAVALVTSTWAFVSLVQHDKLSEYYFYGYMGVWSGINLAKNILGKAPDASTDKA